MALLWIPGLILIGLMAYVRLAPTHPEAWHIDLVANPPADLAAGGDGLQTLRHAAYIDLRLNPDLARARLAGLDAAAMATPRTRRVAGSVEAGHVTWETRSAVWGFPDYTTAQLTDSGLTLYARLRFGGSDFGVNAARLRDWLSRS